MAILKIKTSSFFDRLSSTNLGKKYHQLRLTLKPLIHSENNLEANKIKGSSTI